MERLPRLQHPALLASMAAAISDVAQTRCVFCALGKRPDHETIDAARARIAEVDEDLYRQLKEIASARLVKIYEAGGTEDSREGSFMGQEEEVGANNESGGGKHVSDRWGTKLSKNFYGCSNASSGFAENGERKVGEDGS